MKRMLLIVGLLVGAASSVATAQTRVGVSLSFGDPYVSGHVVIGRPYYHRYARPYYHRYYNRYRPAPVIIVAPRAYRPHRFVRAQRGHRRW